MHIDAPTVEQEVNDVHVARLDGVMKRRIAVRVLRVHLGALVYQQLHAFQAAALHRLKDTRKNPEDFHLTS